MPDITTRCCIAGGGPAGMMLGFLLARAGIDVVVLEKHADFLRDFRGDTVHPSTMQVMHELGLLDGFLARPHSEVRTLAVQIGEHVIQVADFTHLPTRCKFVAFMPQWDFLDFLADQAKRFPTFRLLMQTEATDLIREGDRMIGVTRARPGRQAGASTPDLTIAADGRHSTLRDAAGFEVDRTSARRWTCCGCAFRNRRTIQARRSAASTPAASSSCWIATTTGNARLSSPRAASTRCTLADWRRSAPRSCALAPYLRDRVQELALWDDVKLLTVAVNRLDTWFRPGLLCIGDAAHAMSPVGGVGINLAIQDAVAAANILVRAAARGRCDAGPPARRAAPARVADAHDAARAGCDPEPHHRQRAEPHHDAEAAVRGADARVVSSVAAAAGTHHRHGVQAGAYPALNRFPLRPRR